MEVPQNPCRNMSRRSFLGTVAGAATLTGPVVALGEDGLDALSQTITIDSKLRVRKADLALLDPIADLAEELGNKVDLSRGVSWEVADSQGRAVAWTREEVANLGEGTYTLTYTLEDRLGNKVIVNRSLEVYADEPARGEGEWVRLWGQTALDTMQRIVRADGVFADGRGGYAVVASSEGYWDALSAAGLAGLLKAPVLITPSKSLAPQTREELERLQPEHIVLMGGTAAVSEGVEREIGGYATKGDVVRVWGQNAPATAVDALDAANEMGFRWNDTCIVATVSGFWDALSIAPYAYAMGMPILLNEANGALSDATAAAIKAHRFKHSIIVGGPDSVPTGVRAQLIGAGAGIPLRLAGDTAIDTSAEIARYEILRGMEVTNMCVADGRGWWDALCGAALAGAQNSVLVLSNPDNYTAVDAVYAPGDKALEEGHILGGRDAVPATTEDYLNGR